MHRRIQACLSYIYDTKASLQWQNEALSRVAPSCSTKKSCTLWNSGEVLNTFFSLFFFKYMQRIANWYLHCTYLKQKRYNPESLSSLTVQPFTDGDRLTSRWGENEVGDSGEGGSEENLSSRCHIAKSFLFMNFRIKALRYISFSDGPCDVLNPSQSRWGKHTLEMHYT